MGVEAGVGEFVDLFVVHREEDLAALHGGGEVGLCGDAGAAASDGDGLAVGDAELFGVVGMDFEIAVLGVELAEDFRLSGA